jgi:hypothetical protein
LGVGVIAPASFRTTTGNDGQPYVRIRPAARIADTRLINLLYPATTSNWGSRPTFSLVEDTGEAVAIHVVLNSGRQDDILLTYAKPFATPVGTYFYDGQVAVISRNADDSPNRVFMYGGTRLHYPASQGANTIVVSNLDPGEAFEVLYSPNQTTLRVSGHIVTNVRLYAPLATQLLVNGAATSFTRDGNYILFGPLE